VKPKICVSVSSADVHELYRRARQAEALSADLVEVRLDKLNINAGTSKVAGAVDIPIVGTNRPFSEGGSFRGSESERLEMLMEAVEGGIDYVDLESSIREVDHMIRKFQKAGTKVILSHHDHSRTPKFSSLESTLAKLRRSKPDVCKIVTTARSPEDNLTLLSLLTTNQETNQLVSFAMGKHGVWSRFLAPFYGAPFTYAALEKGLETAAGQISISEMRSIYRMLGAE
jgi:3-dehydroquinate dehydratase type I